MEHYLPIKIGCLEGPPHKQIHLKLLELYAHALFCSELYSWNKWFVLGWEYVENARRTGRPPGLGIQLRIQSELDGLPLASV
jgi:hypothetical protein